ncbi:MAG TPA: hypothetical protein VEI46_09390 [Thermodesulfovibrionales bacterium]|nr:hypothetical protein [Thermodesulfovibrionales bacterium]
MRKHLYLIAAIILLLGLGSSILIYFTAENASESVLGYEPENSKMYLHDLELYGGKANVLANDFMHWFESLWHGTSLAFTIACITVVICFGFLFVANRLPSYMKPNDGGENRGGKAN